MEIQTYLQINLRASLLCLLCLLLVNGCVNHTNRIEDEIDYTPYVQEHISMSQALEMAQKENKMLWTVIGGTESCGYTKEFLRALTKTGFFEKYRDRFIFHTCNPSIPGNEGYWEILSPKAVPNSYIFNNQGNLISLYDYQKQNPLKFANSQIESVLSGKPSNPMMMRDYSMGGKRLLRHLEKLIDIARMSRSGNRDTLLSAQTMLLEIDSLSRNYYYYYQLTRIAGKLGDTLLRNQSADKAYALFAEKSSVRWAGLNDSIKHYSSVYKAEQTKSAKLLFEKETVQYGKIDIGKVYASSFTVENRGTTPLVIFGTHTSCNCVQIDYPKAPILPGTRATVKIEYHANVKGVFLKSVLFRSNASNKVQKIIVEGEVI